MNNSERFRIGNQTAFSAATVTEPFDYAIANNFDAFEWFPDKKESGAGWQESDISPETRVSIREKAQVQGIRLSVHASWQSNPLHADSCGHFEQAVRFAEDVGATLLNVHLYNEQDVASYAEAIIPWLKRLAETEISLAIENTPLTPPHDFNELFGLLFSSAFADLVLPKEENRDFNRLSKQQHNAVRVGMCLDLGHANLCEATHNDYLKFMDQLDPQVPIIHVHLHENYGDSDSHLPLFCGPAGKDRSGITEFIKRLQKRRFCGSIILEQWPDPANLLNEARHGLLTIIENSSQPQRAGLRPVHGAEKVIGADIVQAIAAADLKNRSWREKLIWIDGLLADDKRPLQTNELVYLAIYLRFLGTGEIPSVEDGRHYRPSHHARLARHIHEHLATIASAENNLIIRKIYPWLPSYQSDFTTAEPLTRIRDIAHRNDIPKELKREIKHSLQNKLHRCAGPEDLVTATALLEKITAPKADYSPQFVHEYKRFYEELKEFFNARSLEEQLAALTDQSDKQTIRKFLQVKGQAKTAEEHLLVFDLLTELRGQLQMQLQKSSGAQRQELQNADIKLEDYAFVVTSQLCNQIEAAEDHFPWQLVLGSLTLAVVNLRLSGLDREECLAIEKELQTWSDGFDPQVRPQLLRLRASLDRCRRLAEGYCNEILALFPERVEFLGRALGVAPRARRVFAEADIRRHLVFQLSKLVGLALKTIRFLANLPPWDVIVPGKASGRLLSAARLEQLPVTSAEPVLALLQEVRGDEEIPQTVVGIIVAHTLPHLSHLAVRARQAAVVFVTGESPERLTQLQQSLGKWLELIADSKQVTLQLSRIVEGRTATGGANAKTQIDLQIPEIEFSSEPALLPLSQVTLGNAGSKAYGAKRLAELAKHSGAYFDTPPAAVIPFGVMEQCLRSMGRQRQRCDDLIGRLNDLPGNDFENALQELQNIIRCLKLPQAIIAAVKDRFSPWQRLMVRSSSNCEDLPNIAGAGLYESVPNVLPADVASAVQRVWASLWTQRAVLSRKNLGIAHQRAHMAVLIQELVVPEFSFILHSENPINHSPQEVYLEMAVGLGETLASGREPGTPLRMVYDLRNEAVEVLSFASFSHALWPGPDSDTVSTTVDSSQIRLATDENYRNALATRLGGIAKFVENAFGKSQDIEGVILKDTIYLVQSRPQQRSM